MSSKLTIVMTTHTREPSYVSDSLVSYHETCSEPIKLLVHELESEYDAQGLSNARYLTPEENAEKLSLGQRVRVAHATRLALETADGECILLQDDVKFSKGWLGVLAGHLSELDAEARSRALVSLHNPQRSQVEGMTLWDPKTYWGLQAMFFGAKARQACVEGAFATSGPARLWPQDNNSTAPGADVRLQKFLLDHGAFPLYAIYPSLVQHVGAVSSIGSKDVKAPQERRPPVTWPKSQLKRSR